MIRTRPHARAPGGLLLLLGGVALLAVPSAAEAQDCTEKAADLYAGRTIDVGNVNVCNDADTLTVTYETVSPWCLLATDLHVATNVAGVPRNPAGNPIPGQFADGDSHPECPGTASFEISLADIGANGVGAGDTVVIAAHAEVFNDATSKEEGAWAGTTRFTERGNWATYFTYTIAETPTTSCVCDEIRLDSATTGAQLLQSLCPNKSLGENSRYEEGPGGAIAIINDTLDKIYATVKLSSEDNRCLLRTPLRRIEEHITVQEYEACNAHLRASCGL